MAHARLSQVWLLVAALALAGCGPGGGMNLSAVDIPPPPPPKPAEPPPPPPQVAVAQAPLPAPSHVAVAQAPAMVAPEPQFGFPVPSSSQGAPVLPASSGAVQVAQAPGGFLPNMRPSSAPTGVYQIAAGDVIDVNIFQAQNLNRTVEVDGAGNVVLPLVGAVPVAGRTVRMAEAEIARRYNARYLQNPDVTIFVREAHGARVTVTGAIKKTGFVSAKANMTLLSVIAESGGVTETADETTIMVFRPTQQGRMAARFDVKAIRAGQAPDPPIFGGDTVVVDDSTTRVAWKQFREVLPVLGVFRMFAF